MHSRLQRYRVRAGNDRMHAGHDADTFIGGTGADTFEFGANSLGESGPLVYDSGVGAGHRDRIVDFHRAGKGTRSTCASSTSTWPLWARSSIRV